MPVYDQSYRSHQARAPLRRARFWPITREALKLLVEGTPGIRGVEDHVVLSVPVARGYL